MDPGRATGIGTDTGRANELAHELPRGGWSCLGALWYLGRTGTDPRLIGGAALVYLAGVAFFVWYVVAR